MRLGMTKEIDWDYVGALLANDDENAQAAFFRGFVKECKSWGTSYQVGIQLAGVNHCLSKDEREVLSQITYEESD